MTDKVRLVRYDPKYRAVFVALNRQWIERYFKVEKNDLEQLERLEETILRVGGEIFFVVEGERALGTCAMVPHGPRSYEIAKMAVADEAKGRGFGDRLMEACVAWALEKAAADITILSNTVLEPAIQLYRKHGFETVKLGPHPDYERCNIEMRLNLE
ncbi:MAG: GNAT family N-acetyltransferase [Bdellovibrionota bacterium]